MVSPRLRFPLYFSVIMVPSACSYSFVCFGVDVEILSLTVRDFGGRFSYRKFSLTKYRHLIPLFNIYDKRERIGRTFDLSILFDYSGAILENYS